jgi:pimeloyl-ACP methyl ester carboxylesterase
MRERRDFIEHRMVGRRFSGDGPTCVWIHGLGESGSCFEGVLATPPLVALPTVVPDLPGYGRSPWPIRPEGLADVVEHVAEWMRRRVGAPVVVVGHSMGGVIGVLLAERHPDLVTGLVNIDGNVSPGDCVYSSRAAQVDVGDFTSGGFDRLRQDIRRQGREDPAHAGYWASLRLADPRTFHRHARDLVAMSRAEDLAGRMAGLGCRSLYIAGSPGGACGRSLELLRDADCDVAIIEPSGHWPFLDRPSEVASVISDFTGRCAGDHGN